MLAQKLELWKKDHLEVFDVTASLISAFTYIMFSLDPARNVLDRVIMLRGERLYRYLYFIFSDYFLDSFSGFSAMLTNF